MYINGTARHDCQSGDGYETWTVNAWAILGPDGNRMEIITGNVVHDVVPEQVKRGS